MEMNLPTLLQHLYAFILRLYPSSFQHEFANEMSQVFQDASVQARQQGFRALLAFLLKEFVDLPASLLREHGWILFRKEVHMSDIVHLDSGTGGMSAALGFSGPPVSWKESLLAGLPCLAIALTGLSTLLSGLGLSSFGSPFFRIFSTVLLVALILVGLGIFIFAWRKHWPRWSAGWTMFWLICALTPLNLLFTIRDLSNYFYIYIQSFLWAFILLLVAWLLYRISSQDMIKGILAALPMMSLTWILHQEFVRDDLEGAIALSSWLLVAISMVAILRINRLKAGVLLALGTNLVIGLAYAYEGIYFGGTLNFDAPGPNWIQVLRSFLPQWIAISTLVFGPLMARYIREIGYRIQPSGLWMYRLALLGLLLMLVSNVVHSSIYTTDTLRIVLQGEELVLNILAWFGLVIFIIGFILISGKAVQEKLVKNPVVLLLLGLFSLFVPFGLMFGLPSDLWLPSLSLLHDLRFPLHGFPKSLGFVSQFPEFSVVLIGVMFMLAATWLAVYLNSTKQPAENRSFPS